MLGDVPWLLQKSRSCGTFFVSLLPSVKWLRFLFVSHEVPAVRRSFKDEFGKKLKRSGGMPLRDV